MRRMSAALLMPLLILLGTLSLAPIAGAAIPPEGSWEWTQPYTAAATLSTFRGLAAGPAGSVYVCGDAWDWRWTVSRVDAATGAEIWTDTRLGPGGTGASAVAMVSDRQRNLFVLGRAQAGDGNFYLVKYSPTGAVLWQRSWDGPLHLEDRPTSVAVTRTGDVYVAGMIGKPVGYDDAVLLKYDSAGHLKWKYITATSLYDSFDEVACDAYGNAYLTGQRAGSMASAQMITLKVGSTGHLVWQRAITGLGVSYNGQHLRVKGPAVYVTGALYKNGMWPIVAKYSLAGKKAWATAGDGTVESIDDMAVDAKGRVVTVGSFKASPGPTLITTAELLVFAANGKGLDASMMFYADYGPSNEYATRFNRVVVCPDGTMYAAGAWETNASGTEGNALVARIPAIETPLWSGVDKIWRYDGVAGGVDEFWALLRLSDTEIYAAGTQHTGGGSQAFAHRITLP